MPFDSDQLGHEQSRPEWAEGRKAYLAGTKYDDNPYRYSSEEYDAWAQGWQEALTCEAP